jgi:histidinol-phosphate aminotransferase
MTRTYLELAVPGIRGLAPYQPGKPESELRREYGLERVVKLASNENPLGPGPLALEAAGLALRECGRYPDGNGFELKAALADQLRCEPDRITLGNGSNDVLELLARCFVTPAEQVLFSRHAFAIYALVTQALGAGARIAEPNSADHERPYGHDLTALRSLVDDHTRLIFIANPNNPTGTWLGADELEAFIDSLPTQVIVVVDEAYHEYVQAPDYRSSVAWLERYPNLVVTRTFSKAYGLAGLRVGFSISHPQVAELLGRLRQPFNVNLPGQAAAAAALRDHAHLQRSLALNRTEMTRVVEALAGIGLRSIPSVANFLCVEFGDRSGAVYEGLLRRGVIVRPVANYGLPRHLRITIGTAQENSRLLQLLPEVMR